MRFASLFSGVGGFDLGLEAAGMTCVAQVEWDKHCQRVLRHHWPDVPKWSDVADVNGADLPEAELIAFGSPCQDLSVAGRRAGFDGDHSVLFYEATRIIREMRDASSGRYPTWVAWENVAGALSSSGGRDFAAVLDDLADAGALVLEWAVLDARWFGVPQRRRRVFLVACFDPRTAERCPDPLLPVGPRRARDTGQSDPTRQDVAGTLGGGSGSRGWAPDTDRMTFVPIHTRTFVEAERAQTNTTLNAMDNGSESRATVVAIDSTWSGAYPPSIDVSPPLKQAHGTVPAIPDGLGVRRLTPRECERLMGWPDDHTRFADDGTEIADSHRYRQCGNGVAAPVAEWVGRQIMAVGS